MSILPKIDKEKLASIEMMDKVSEMVLSPPSVAPPKEEEDPVREPNTHKDQDEMFEKKNVKMDIAPPKEEEDHEVPVVPKEVVEISKKTGKPKRKLTQKQLDGLAKAREKSRLRRMEIKESKLISREQKKIEREIKKEEKIVKQEEQDSLIRLKAQLKSEVQKETTWDEERLSGLMMKTIDTYMEKKKAQKPKPRIEIPNQNNNMVLDQKYYHTAPFYGHHAPRPPPQHWVSHKVSKRPQPTNQSALDTLFGNYTEN